MFLMKLIVFCSCVISTSVKIWSIFAQNNVVLQIQIILYAKNKKIMGIFEAILLSYENIDIP